MHVIVQSVELFLCHLADGGGTRGLEKIEIIGLRDAILGIGFNDLHAELETDVTHWVIGRNESHVAEERERAHEEEEHQT